MKLSRRLPVLLFISLCFIITLGYVNSTAEDTVILLEGEPRNIAVNPYSDQAFVASKNPNELSVIDMNTAQIIGTIPLGKQPMGLAVDAGMNRLLVTHKVERSLSILNLTTHQVLATLTVGRSPCNVAVYESAGSAHLGLTANYQDNTVSVVDLNNSSVTQTIPVGQGPRDIAVDPTLKQALVANEKDNTLSIIDLVTMQVTGQIPVGSSPRSVSINPETHKAIVANAKANFITIVNLIDRHTYTIPVDKNPVDTAINRLDNRALVLCNDTYSLHYIDLNTNTTLHQYPLSKKSRGVAVNPFTNIAAAIDGLTDSLTLIQLPNPVPEITSISPMTVARGSLETHLSIQGSGFLKTSTVSLQPFQEVFPITFTDNHQLTVTLPQTFLAQARNWMVVVANPAPEGGVSNSAVLSVVNPVPVITAIDPASTPTGGPGLTLTVYGTGFFPDTSVSLNGAIRPSTYISGTELRVTFGSTDIASAGTLSITASNLAPGGGISNPMSFTVMNPVPILSSINPNNIKAGSPGFTLSLTGSNFVSTSSVLFNNTPVTVTYVDSAHLTASIPASAVATKGTNPVVVTNPGPGGGTSGSINFIITPSSNVQPLPEGSYGKTYEDLIPPDATIPSYDPKRFSLITGLVKEASGNPLSGVSVGIHSLPEYGTTQTDPTGRFSLPLDGGGTITATYQKSGFLTAHRQVNIGWNTIANAETIVMIPEDTASTALTFDGNPQTILTHRSTPTMDSFGTRSLTTVFTGDNRAWVKDAQGIEQPLTNITVRATEYPTPESMPAKLPPTSAFTYCAELTVDGAKSVRFEKPMVVYVDNFLGFNVGEIVPVGFYDRDRAVWVPQNNGRVVQLLDTNTDGIVDSFTDGINQYPAPGLNDPNLYPPNATFWRVEHSHFSPADYNWPYGFPGDAVEPNPEGDPDADTECQDDDCTSIGSYVENRSRIFHEDIPIPGTDMTLHYASNRVKGYKSGVSIPASGDNVPGSLKNIIVKMEVAGRTYQTTLPSGPNQKVDYVWDGLDYLGRQVAGATLANISIGFVYQGVYYTARSNYLQSFAQTGANVTGIAGREEIISWKHKSLPIYQNGNTNLAEGWSFSSLHYMNPSNPNILQKGDGGILKNDTKIIDTIAGNGQYGFSGDGGPASQASLTWPLGLAVDPAGNIYIGDDDNNRIRKIDANGIITTIAGNGQYYDSGDGGPAIQAGIGSIMDIALDRAGNVYIAGNSRIRKIDAVGIITTIAGNGQYGYSGDGGLATQAKLMSPRGITVDVSGNIYIVGSSRIRKIDPNGIITTIAGTGSSGCSGDGGPAVQARIGWVENMSLDKEGNIYLADDTCNSVRKIDNSGIISTVAGNGTFMWPYGIAVDNQKNIYVSDIWYQRIWKIDASGVITPFAGNGQSGSSGDGGPAYQASIYQPVQLAISNDNSLLIGEFSRVRKVSSIDPKMSLLNPGDILFSDPNGQGYIMSSTGLHRTTIDLETGKTLLTFGYDSANKLVSITDRFGNQTTIQRDGSGVPLSITSPDGIVTRLTVDSNNHLTAVTYPDNSANTFTYTSEGLMTDKYDPRGNRFRHVFDPNGLITNVFDPEGGSWSFSRSVDNSGTATVTMETGEGNTTTYQDRTNSTGAYTSITTSPFGSLSAFTRSSDGLTETNQPSCGMNQTMKYDLDPAFKYKYLKEFTQRSPAGLALVTTNTRTYQDTNGDTISDLINRSLSINNRNWTTLNNTLTGTVTSTSPLGRAITSQYDPATIQTTRRIIPGFYDTVYAYDNKGRLTSLTRNSRTSSFSYNPQGFLSSITDPENSTTVYSYDTMGRVIRLDGPNGYSLNFTYDPNGNMTLLTNPSLINHGFGYNAVNLNSSYQTPLSGSYGYLYDKERNLVRVTFPSGILINNIYSQGRLVRTETPEGNIVFNYLCDSKVGNITKGTEGINYTYDGSLITSETLSGSLNQGLQYTYNNDFNLSSLTYSGQTVNLSYDNDGLLNGAGSFTIGRNAANGLPTSVNGGALNLNRTFNGYGEENGEVYSIGGNSPLSWSLTRTNTGRISIRMETVDGTSTNYTYIYDPMGRLLSAARDGSIVEEYQYTPNGTRTHEVNTLRGIAGRNLVYSAEDHLLTAGNVSYQYNLDGFLTSKTQGTSTTTYQYSSRGELLSVSLPDGRTIEYLHDPLARRIGKKINGTITEKYLWQGRTRLLAVYDGNDNLIMRFNYGDGRTPVSMTKAGATYYLAYDQVGSLKVATDSLGNVVKKIDYDSFGNIITDTSPSFTIPFGFAGGLHDRDMELVRFGYRDYSPEVGRWTAKDPILFQGGDTDLFGYVLSNPVTRSDSRGLEIFACGRPVEGFLGDVFGAQHAYLWDSEGKSGYGMGGSSGIQWGENRPTEIGPEEGASCNMVEGSKGMESKVMDYMKDIADMGPWIPFLNDCHNKVGRTLKYFGLQNPGVPGGRFID